MVACGVLLFTTIFGYVSGHFQLKPSHYRENFAWDNDSMMDWDAQEAARLSLHGSNNIEAPERVQLLNQMTGEILFQGKNGDENLLEKKYLEEIEKFEKKIKSMKENRWLKLCWAKSSTDTQCNEDAWVSPLRFLDGSSAFDMSQEEIDKKFWTKFGDKNNLKANDQ